MSLATHCIPYNEDCTICNPESEQIGEMLEGAMERLALAITHRTVQQRKQARDAARSEILSLFTRLQRENEEARREGVLAFYNGCSATTRRYVSDQAVADRAIDEINAACEKALRRLSTTEKP